MGEAKDREAASEAARSEEMARQQELQKMLSTPITKKEAELALADADVNQAQILVARQKLIAKQAAYKLGIAETQRGIDECDEALASIVLTRNIIYRRSLNAATEGKPVMGEPVKTA